MKELTETEAFNKAAAYCSRCEHCLSEVKEKLCQWGVFDELVHQRIVSQLMDEGYVDEGRFCRAYVRDKFRFNHWGRQKIAMSLCQKGLPSALVDDVLDELITDEDASEAAFKVLQAKVKSVRADNPYELYSKLMRFAASRGIERSVAYQAINRLVDADDDDV